MVDFKQAITVVAAGLVSGSALANTLDTSRPLLCASLDVFECVDGRDCQPVLPEAIDAPTFFRVHIKDKEVVISDDRPVSKIEHIEEVENRIVLQGTEDGLAAPGDGVGWTISIQKDTARMVLTGAGRQAAFVIFGACTEL